MIDYLDMVELTEYGFTAFVMVAAVVILVIILIEEIKFRRSPNSRAYRAGRKAQREGKGLLDNPYERSTEESGRWYSGWRDEHDAHSKK